MAKFNPVFICGAGRSGTTLLYRLLCMNEQVGFVSNYDAQFLWTKLPNLFFQHYPPNVELRLKSWFDRDGNAYFADRPWIKKMVPTPKEGEGLYTHCGLSLKSCERLPSVEVKDKLRQTFEGLQASKGTPVLLSKRTANNRRIPCLAEAFPEAKFIHMIRDGRSVAHSLERVKWWPDHALWWHDYQTPRQLVERGGSHLALAAKDWVKGNRAISKGLTDISRAQVLEIRYEELLKNPHATTRLLFKFMGVPMTSGFKKALKKLDLSEREENWSNSWDQVQQYVVDEIQSEDLTRYGYK